MNDSSIQALAQRLRARAAKDEELAKTNLNQPDAFMYVMGRAHTLKIIAEELDAILSTNP